MSDCENEDVWDGMCGRMSKYMSKWARVYLFFYDVYMNISYLSVWKAGVT